jgi:hypothetical protein
MALIDDFTGRPAQSDRARGFNDEVFQTIGLAVSALAAGWRAAKDYDRLSAARATAREDLPQEVYRRHFARLGEARNRR